MSGIVRDVNWPQKNGSYTVKRTPSDSEFKPNLQDQTLVEILGSVTMQSIVLPRSLLVGLCAYLNQAQLSLDRVQPTAAEHLTRFYDTCVAVPLQAVIERLQGMLGSHAPATTDWRAWSQALTSWRYVLATTISSFASWHSRRAVLIPAWQAAAILQVLKEFSDIVRKPQLSDQATITDIRLRLAYGALMLERRIPVRHVLRDIRLVCYLNQAEHLKLKGVEDIAGKDWLIPVAGNISKDR